MQPATITFEEGVITAIHCGKSAQAEDFGSLVIMPGVIDVHVHINEPGRTEWEGFDTGSQAAAAGGTTTFVDMPLNASPVTTSVEAFQEKLSSTEGKLHVNAGFYAGLIPGNIQQLEPLLQTGVLGVKCFLTHSGIDDFPNVTEGDLELAMPIIAKYDLPLLAHCEWYEQEVFCEFEQHPRSYRHYLASRPKKWENDAIAMMIRLCRKHRCPIHIVHVASDEALLMIEEAKKEGLPITAETCVQYMLFHAELIPDGKTIFKCAPPIREKANNERLKHAFLTGVLDFITTDHSPAPPAIKELETGNLKKAWGGIAGIQFLLSGSWTAMSDIISLENFIPLLTSAPAAFIKCETKGQIALNYDADFVIWDPTKETVITEEAVFFRHKISPYIGQSLKGEVVETIVNGQSVFKNHVIQNKNKGKWLLKK